MIRRSRTRLALLALIALSAFLTESAWAIVCPPAMEMGGSVVGVVADAGAHTGGTHHSAPAPDNSEHAPSGSSDSPDCPLGMASAGGACASGVLPAATGIARPPAAERETALLPSDHTLDLLLVAGHFRPPRA